MAYQHSETFAKLKGIKDYELNLTSFQWLTILDHFIESALDPIATAAPLYLDNYFCKVLAHQFTKPTINYSRNSRHDLPCLLFNSLVTSGKYKREYQKQMVLNRGLLFGCVQLFQKIVNNYVNYHNKEAIHLNNPKLESDLGGSYLYASAIQVEYWYDLALWFKGVILGKYTRLALMQSKRVYQEVDHALNLDDIIQIYLSYVNKAVERCDSRQGVLTTYIQTWFYSARTEVLKLVKEQQRSECYTDLLEHQGSSNFADDIEATQHILVTAKEADPKGYIRASLGIPEYLPSHQQRLLKTFAVNKEK